MTFGNNTVQQRLQVQILIVTRSIFALISSSRRLEHYNYGQKSRIVRQPGFADSSMNEPNKLSAKLA